MGNHLNQKRKARISELRNAAKDVDECVSTSRNGVVFWGTHGNGGPVGLIVTEYKSYYHWCTTAKNGQMDSVPYATEREAIRAGLLDLAKQQEARLLD